MAHDRDVTRKIRNTGRTIDVDGRLPALERVLRGEESLVAVDVYGSYGTRFQTPLSDVDLAVLFADGSDPQGSGLMELIGTITGALREDDVSGLVLNRAPLAMQHRVLARGRRLIVVDEAPGDFEAFITAIVSAYLVPSD